MLRDIVHKNWDMTRYIEVDDHGVILDADTPQEFQEFLNNYKQI